MGSCRLLNVLLGMSLHQENGVVLFSATHWWIAVCIGLFVAGLTWFARTEQTRSARPSLIAAAGVMLASIVALALLPQAVFSEVPGMELPEPDAVSRASRFLAILVVMLLPLAMRVCGAIASPGPANVQRAVVAGLMAMILIDASVCYLFGHTTFGFTVALLIIPGAILGRWIRGT
jgi:4-hydroxybenzoate polyprenyltransferase